MTGLKKWSGAALKLYFLCFFIGTACAAAQPLALPESSTVIAVGDIADCSSENPDVQPDSGLPLEELQEHGLTGRERLPAHALRLEDALEEQPGIILALGDLAYPDGTEEDFNNCFGKVWKPLLNRTYAVPGNHEYHSNALPYRAFFGEKNDATETYFSFDVGNWRLIGLDSELYSGPLSSQRQWLVNDLAGAKGKCALAFFHRPAYSSLPRKGHQYSNWLFETLSSAGVSIVLNGHNHFYERTKNLNAAGEVTGPHGTRIFVVGTGGESHAAAHVEKAAFSDKLIEQETGYLKLALRTGSYSWWFISSETGKVLDQGEDACTPQD